MYKLILAFLFSSLFIGCSNFTINGTMCDRVKVDPLATIPAECRKYSEEEAEKAFNKEEKILAPGDIIKVDKE